MIQKERIGCLNRSPLKDRQFVLYWMQAAQRTHWNHALQYAIRTANDRKKPVLAAFSLTDDFPEANLRHYAFLLEGLKETQKSLADLGIQLVILHGAPTETIPPLAKQADLLVMDDGYLRIERNWRKAIAAAIDCTACQVTTNVIVPVEEASDKENFSAGTLRPRIRRQLDKFLVPLKQSKPAIGSLGLKIKSFDISDTTRALSKLSIDRSVAPSDFFKGGLEQANRYLTAFIRDKLDDYGTKKQADPLRDCQSHLSPYLHFGQISPLYIALEIMKTESSAKDAFLEQLIIRRELSFNFVYYNPDYDTYKALPHWALRTLAVHAKDKRYSLYTQPQLENAQTQDAVWNAAQREMVLTGKLHNYMRMYWGKKILEWSLSPRDGFKTALHLNNKYHIDGRDPNSFAGVAWCFGKHDRPWKERPIFGKVRYMNDAGLNRKFKTAAYIEKIDGLWRAARKDL